MRASRKVQSRPVNAQKNELPKQKKRFPTFQNFFHACVSTKKTVLKSSKLFWALRVYKKIGWTLYMLRFWIDQCERSTEHTFDRGYTRYYLV